MKSYESRLQIRVGFTITNQTYMTDEAWGLNPVIIYIVLFSCFIHKGNMYKGMHELLCTVHRVILQFIHDSMFIISFEKKMISEKSYAAINSNINWSYN